MIKKLISLLLALCFVFSLSVSAFALDEEDIEVEAGSASVIPGVEPLTTGLICSYSLSFSRGEGLYNKIYGKTNCLSTVVKCGMIDIKVQSRLNSNYSWADYMTLDDYTVDNMTCTYNRSIAFPAGRQYRITWKHYAKKSLLSTEKISNTSNTITIPAGTV